MRDKVATVVVTYNRIDLLKKCIDSLQNQSRKLDEIIIVNNSSTDGTYEWLNKQRDLTVITQSNSGSAGGQYTGMKYAYEKGYDWIWCMDDDCLPALNALESLLYYSKNDTILNSLVVAANDPCRLSFGLFEIKKKKYYQSLDDVSMTKLIEAQNFFNGTLFPATAFKKIGYPIKELFIRGDEYEYYLRLINSGFQVYTVTNSIVYHPKEVKIVLKNWLFYYEFSFLDTVKRFFHIRNLFFITRHYKSSKYFYFFKSFFLDIIFILLFQRSIRILVSHFRGLVKGISMRADFTG